MIRGVTEFAPIQEILPIEGATRIMDIGHYIAYDRPIMTTYKSLLENYSLIQACSAPLGPSWSAIMGFAEGERDDMCTFEECDGQLGLQCIRN